MHEAGQFIPALVLYREAILDFSKVALIASTGDEAVVKLSPASLFEQFVALLDARAPNVGTLLKQGLGGLLDFGTLSIDSLPQHARACRAAKLDAASRSLVGLVVPELVPPRRLGQKAYLAVVVGVALAVLALSWLAWHAYPNNVALNRPTTAGAQPFGGGPQGAVDGRHTSAYGFASALGPNPWLAIDLQQRYVIDRAAVYGRNDCCFDQSMPLEFAVSDDGVTYRPLETRLEPFVLEQPWVIQPRNVAARFVRLRTLRESSLVLGEVEVYGSRAE
jgi:hypothetical protein